MVIRNNNFETFYKKIVLIGFIIFVVQLLFSQDKILDYPKVSDPKVDASSMQDSFIIEVSKISVNSNRSDFCPVFYKDGIIFYSNRIRSDKSDVNFINNSEADIFFTSIDNGIFSEPIDFNELIGYVYYEGSFTFYNDFNKMFVSKYTSSLGSKIKKKDILNGLRIFESDIDTSKNVLYTLDPLPFIVQGFSFEHPTTSSNGNILIFSSNIPNGFGGSDLYISKQSKGFWLPPENLGDKINTQNDEYFPYLLQDSILVFTSNKSGGHGKFDLYITTLNSLLEPKNLGTPINSESDDFSLIVSADGEHGYFSSNRDDASKEDIYRFEFVSGSIKNNIEDNLEETTPNNLSLSISDDFIVKDIPVEETQNEDSKETETFEESELQFPEEKQENNLVYRVQIAASKKQLLEKEVKRKYNGERPVVMFQEEGWYKYYIGEFESYFVADKIKKESGVKDAFIVAYQQNDKLALMDAMRTQYKMEWEEYKIVDEEIPANWEVIDKQELFFDFNSFGESSLNSKSLVEIINILAQNQNYRLAIFAYADYFGSIDYNLALSAERGKMVKRYLVVEGISENRIIIKSFGEKFTGNNDTIPVLYNKQDNKINRKVEFIIYKIR